MAKQESTRDLVLRLLQDRVKEFDRGRREHKAPPPDLYFVAGYNVFSMEIHRIAFRVDRSMSAVRRALRKLKDEGLVERYWCWGTYRHYAKTPEVRRWQKRRLDKIEEHEALERDLKRFFKSADVAVTGVQVSFNKRDAQKILRMARFLKEKS